MTRNTQRVPLRAMIGPIAGLARAGALVLAGALLIEACVLMAPLMLRIIIDRAVGAEQWDLLYALPLVFVALALVHGMLVLGRGRSLLGFSERLNMGWLSNLFDRLMQLRMSYFESRGVGAIAAKFWSVSYMQRVLTAAFLEGILDGALAIFGLALLVVVAPRVAAVACICIVAYAAARAALYRVQFRADAARSGLAITQQSYLWETVSGIQSVRLAVAEDSRKTLWFSELGKLMDADRAFQNVDGATRALAGFLTTACRLGAVVVLAPALASKSISAGTLVAAIAYADLLVLRAVTLADKLTAFRLLDVHRDKLQELLLEPTVAADPDPNGRAFDATRAKLELRDATLSVAGGRALVTGADFVAEPGSCVVIVGPSGGGKTTLLKALLGLVDFQAGQCLVDGVPMSRVARRQYYRSVATVLREDRLFNTTILANIRFGSPDASEDWAIQCARDVGLHDYIASLPDGYLTTIKDDGSHVSAGQRQRLLIARALCRRPSFLFLDEATSHLDPASEQGIVELIGRLPATRIVVSHRPAPLFIADRVYRLEHGRLEPDGAVRFHPAAPVEGAAASC